MARLIGTAGHVDHGKTTLIRALTGIDADRLPEEKARGMTIDIGFAYVDLPEIGRVSIVDVPGHERFITNMLVGAQGIDVALLCVAADAGVMPQTREHLQILELLPVERMVVALTRADLADETTRELATEEVIETLGTTRFSGCPIIAVSAQTGEGIESLREALADMMKQPTDAGSGPWFLPIDRAFSVKGYGSVVTGTLARGQVKVGDRGYLEPGHVEIRVRGIQWHEQPQDSAERGRRTALNLGGIKLEELHRGMAVGAPGALFETRVLDAKVRWVQAVKHGARIRVSIGAAEAIGKAFLNDMDPELLQIRLETPVAAAKGQPLIVRRYSPPTVLAGGLVLVPHARTRRKSELAEVTAAPAESPEAAIVQALKGKRAGLPTEELARVVGIGTESLSPLLDSMRGAGSVLGFAGLWFESETFNEAAQHLLATLMKGHDRKPTVGALSREAVVEEALLNWKGKPLDRILAHLAAEGRLSIHGNQVRHADFRVRLNPKQRDFLDRIVSILDQSGVQTPTIQELAAKVPAPPPAIEEIVRIGLEAGEIVRVADGLYYTPEQLSRVRALMVERLGSRPFSAATFRDLFGSSRKFVIPLLEYFDTMRFTVRRGDERVIQDVPQAP